MAVYNFSFTSVSGNFYWTNTLTGAYVDLSTYNFAFNGTNDTINIDVSQYLAQANAGTVPYAPNGYNNTGVPGYGSFWFNNGAESYGNSIDTLVFSAGSEGSVVIVDGNYSGASTSYIQTARFYTADGTYWNGYFQFRGPGTVVVCFTRGALISTCGDEQKKIEDIRAGDLVMTKDSGLQKVRWIGSSHVKSDVLEQFENRRPIKFSAGALGDHPEFSVSPQHKLLMDNSEFAGKYDVGLTLVPAKHLVNGLTVTVDNSVTEVEYFHIMFDKHEVILADNFWSESFYPGEYIMGTIDSKTREEITYLFPQIDADEDELSYERLSYPQMKRRDAIKYFV